MVEWNELRYTPLRNRLPRGEIIGYTSDVDPGLSIAGASGLYLAQYALVPAVVDRGTPHPLVVGNFQDPTAPTFFRTNSSWEVITNLRNGVFLFKTKAK